MVNHPNRSKRHTPGPWQALPTRHGGIIGPRWEVRAGNISIADLRDNGHNSTHGAANARLIAAAPELYEALEAVRPYFEGEHYPDHPHCRLMRAALAKALGED